MIETHFLGASRGFPQFAYSRALAVLADHMARVQQQADLNGRGSHRMNCDGASRTIPIWPLGCFYRWPLHMRIRSVPDSMIHPSTTKKSYASTKLCIHGFFSLTVQLSPRSS